jgi:shikimate kinase
LGRIKELLEYRRPFYEKADFHVMTDGMNVASVVEKVRKIVDEESKAAK